jgi:hypothetical protein
MSPRPKAPMAAPTTTKRATPKARAASSITSRCLRTITGAVPTTYDELVTLCSTINNAKISVGDREYVKPFAWSGADRQYYWDYPMFEWWAQLAGVDKINTIKKYMGPTGKYSDGYEMYNPANYYKEFVEAYDKWWSLIANASANSISTSYSDKLGTAQSAFNAGKAAMIPYAQWGKYELEKTNGGSFGFRHRDDEDSEDERFFSRRQLHGRLWRFDDNSGQECEPRFSQAVPRLYGDRRWLQDLR